MCLHDENAHVNHVNCLPTSLLNHFVKQEVIVICLVLGIESCAFTHEGNINRVITTMVIRPLDDPTLCAQSVVADLRPLDLGFVWSRRWAHSIARPWVPISSLLTHMVYLLQIIAFACTFPYRETQFIEIEC